MWSGIQVRGFSPKYLYRILAKAELKQAKERTQGQSLLKEENSGRPDFNKITMFPTFVKKKKTPSSRGGMEQRGKEIVLY